MTKPPQSGPLFPTFANWYNHLPIPEATREGIPKGDPMPIGGDKYRAAAMMLLYPRGLPTGDMIGKAIGTSGGVVRNWKGEKAFQNLVARLENKFSVYVLQRLHDPAFFQRLFISSLHEPLGWSLQTLKGLIVQIGEKMLTSDMSNNWGDLAKDIEKKCEAIRGVKKKREATQEGALPASLEQLLQLPLNDKPSNHTPGLPVNVPFVLASPRRMMALWYELNKVLTFAESYSPGQPGPPPKEHERIARKALVRRCLKIIDINSMEMDRMIEKRENPQEILELNDLNRSIISKIEEIEKL